MGLPRWFVSTGLAVVALTTGIDSYLSGSTGSTLLTSLSFGLFHQQRESESASRAGAVVYGNGCSASRLGATRRRKTVVISQWTEDVSFALELPEAGWDVVVISKDSASAARIAADAASQNLAPFFEIVALSENWGDEVVPYLTYLASCYDALPPLVVFLQGHPFVHAAYLADTLACINPGFEGFWSINGMHMSNRGALAGPGHEDELWALFRARANAEWAAAGVNYSIPLLESVDFYASAQFLVSRSAVTRQPRAFWEALLRVALNVRSGFPTKSKASWEETARRGKLCAYFLRLCGTSSLAVHATTSGG